MKLLSKSEFESKLRDNVTHAKAPNVHDEHLGYGAPLHVMTSPVEDAKARVYALPKEGILTKVAVLDDYYDKENPIPDYHHPSYLEARVVKMLTDQDVPHVQKLLHVNEDVERTSHLKKLHPVIADTDSAVTLSTYAYYSGPTLGEWARYNV